MPMEVKSLLDSDEYDFRFDVALSYTTNSISLFDRDRIVSSLASYFTVIRVKAQINQLIEGLHVLGVFDLIQANLQKSQQLFVHSKLKPMTADEILNIFTARLSLLRSNKREQEEKVVMQWVNFVQEIESI